MSFPRYPEYKDSGVEWLGKVPEHWSVVPLKAVVSCNDEVLPESTPEDFEIEYVEISGVDVGKGIVETSTTRFKSAASRARRIVRDGDVLVSTVRTYLRAIASARQPAPNLIASTGFAVLRPRHIDSAFLGYSCQAEHWISAVISRSVGVSYPAINASDLVSLPVGVPPLNEQAAIASFLDRETAKIDALVAEQEKLIALLQEKRQAVISHAVTKGLDPNVPMKDSGVEWLGEVPAHWGVVQFRRQVFIAEGQVNPELAEFRDMTLIAPNHVESGTGRLLALETAEQQSAESGKYQCKAGDVIYSKIRPGLRKVCLAPCDSLCSADMYPLRPYDGLISEFLVWFMLSDQFSSLAVLESERVAMPKINRDTLNEVMIVLPPVYEQVALDRFLTATTAKLDSLIAQAQSTITLLQERRTALISAAVTGQIDVRGLARDPGVPDSIPVCECPAGD